MEIFSWSSQSRRDCWIVGGICDFFLVKENSRIGVLKALAEPAVTTLRRAGLVGTFIWHIWQVLE